MATFFFLFAFALALSLLFGLSTQTSQKGAQPAEKTPIRVTHVYDGDTLKVESEDKVRLLGIDALDSYNQRRLKEQARQLGMRRKDVRKWSQKAHSVTKKLVGTKLVRLEYGPERTDEYGRLLTYVYLTENGKETLVNRRLIAEGLATAMRAFPHPLRSRFIEVEKQARRQKRGLWKDATRVP